MASTPQQILDRFYAAEEIYFSAAADPAARDFAAMAATLSPNIALHQSPDLPYGGVYRGHDGFLKWSNEMSKHFTAVEVSDRRILTVEDNIVILSTLRLTLKDGSAVANPFAQHMKVDCEKGVITEMRPFYWDVRGLGQALAKAATS